ncbi:MAG TPA: hypothetical protein VM074_01935 [Solimonas sp.]|nr:hypothetical protein [Solimonas sp.]
MAHRRGWIGGSLGAALGVFLLAGAGLASPRGPEPVALVADVEGAVLVTHPGDESAVADLFSSLPVGAVLTVPAQARLTLVYYAGSREYHFAGPDSITLGLTAPASLSGAEAEATPLRAVDASRGLSPEDVRQLVLGGLEVRGAGVRKRIQLRNPVGTVITEPQPVFSWTPLEADTEYRFALRDERGEVLLDTLLTRTRLRLPEGIALADGGAYSWSVEAPGPAGRVVTGEFRVADAGQRETLAALKASLADGATSDRVLYALLLQKLGMQGEAAATLQRLAAERPNSAQLQRISAQATLMNPQQEN